MKKIGLELMTEVKYVSQLQGKGDYLSFVVSEGNLEANDYNSCIHLYDTKSQRKYQLTTGKKDNGYLWLDDEHILFRGDRDEKKPYQPETIFYKINIHGGEAVSFITLPHYVAQVKLHKNKLYFTAAFNADLEHLKTLEGTEKESFIKTLKENEDYDVVTEIPFWSNGGSFTKGNRMVLYCYDIETKETCQLTKPPFTVEGIFCDDQYDSIFVTGQNFENKRGLLNHLFILEDTLKPISYETFGFRQVRQISDEEIIFSGSDLSTYGLFENSKFYKYNLKTQETKPLTPGLKLNISNAVGSDLRYGNGMSLFGHYNDGLIVPLLNGFKNELHLLKDDLSLYKALPGVLDEHVVLNGKLYGIGLFNQEFQELYDLESMTKLTDFNQEIKASYQFFEPEHFTFKNREGLLLDGFIIKPEVEGKAPCILNIHGGPKTAYGDILYHEMQYWATKGYVVIYTNPRGSEGRDNEFADIRGKYGTIEYNDIMDFVDACIDKYDCIDVNRLGVTGGSYGGFMTNWIISHTNRFKAAATQRSIANWFSFFGTSDIGYFFAPDQVASTPWDNPELMWQQSPIKYADQIKTPTLIIHSHADYRCWTPDAYQLFTALKHFDIPSKMVLFKGENHELSRGGKPKHRVRRLKEITEWMDKYL